MNLYDYKNELENLSRRLPFDYIQFIDIFEDFIHYYNGLIDKAPAQKVYAEYKLLTTYVIRLNCKLVESMMIHLIPDRMHEFDTIVEERRNRVNMYHKRLLLTEDERINILNMVEEDRAEIINKAIWTRMLFVNSYPTSQGIKDVMYFTKLVKIHVPEIDMKLVYRWRTKTYLRILGRKLTCCL